MSIKINNNVVNDNEFEGLLNITSLVFKIAREYRGQQFISCLPKLLKEAAAYDQTINYDIFLRQGEREVEKFFSKYTETMGKNDVVALEIFQGRFGIRGKQIITKPGAFLYNKMLKETIILFKRLSVIKIHTRHLNRGLLMFLLNHLLARSEKALRNIEMIDTIDLDKQKILIKLINEELNQQIDRALKLQNLIEQRLSQLIP